MKNSLAAWGYENGDGMCTNWGVLLCTHVGIQLRMKPCESAHVRPTTRKGSQKCENPLVRRLLT